MVSFPPRLSTDQGWGELFYINHGLITERVIPVALKSKKKTEQGCELHEGRACVCFIHWCTPTPYPRRAPSICIEWTLNEWALSGSHHAINSHSISHQVDANHFPTEPSYSGHLPSFAPQHAIHYPKAPHLPFREFSLWVVFWGWEQGVLAT